MPSTLTVQAFVAKWRKNTRKERSAAQEHFIDLCRLIAHPTPGEAASSSTYDFEAGASKQTGGSGWADVWKRGYFAWEYKGKHADLTKAYQQLLQYRESLENPPLLVVSDLDTIEIHTNFTNTVKQVYRLTLDDLLTPGGQQHLHNVFYAPDTFRAPQSTQQVTEAAAREFARLADLLRRWKEDPHQIAHFLIRLLFCLFAEDIGLLPAGLFSRLIHSTHMRPQVFAQQLRQLFRAMAQGEWFGPEEILHFNGRLFDDDTVLELDSESMDILARASQLDWSSIEPSILGTLFERSLDPSKRSQLGAHYTSKEDILLIIEPVLMAPLRRTWADIKMRAHDLAAKRTTMAAAQRTRIDNELRTLLTGFSSELAQVHVLDPACGSGNFLYVALKQLLDLEKEVITAAGDLELGLFFPSVSPEQLHGIELNAYAHELAQITVWIGYIQWLRDNGFGQPSEPILKPLDTIVQMDAILSFDEQGQPTEPQWPEADIIIGNPPFLGDKKMRSELGDAYVTHLRTLYQGRVPGGADLVTYWFERARALIESNHVRSAGLLATNSIAGGINRRILERIKQTGDIFMAWNDRPWVLEGAAVRVAMVGFDGGTTHIRHLNGAPVTTIGADLHGDLTITIAQQLVENARLAFIGDTKKGQFDIDETLARQMLSAPINPNGRSNADVIVPWVNGLDITRRPRNMWIIDFGLHMPEAAAALYEQPYEYVRQHVKPARDLVRNTLESSRWWLHARPAPDCRMAIQHLDRYIATPTLSKYRLFVWLRRPTLPDHQLVVIARDDDYFFGVLHAKPHELWSLRMGTSLEDRPRYTPTTTFETFPFPWPPGSEPVGDSRVDAIAAAARELVENRDRWLNPDGASETDLKKRTLTNLYNERPTWLDFAHRKLDQAVSDAYGWPHDLSDEEILSRLLTLNLERTIT